MQSTFLYKSEGSNSLNGCGCGCGTCGGSRPGLGAVPLDPEEQEKARETAKETVKEATNYSNPNIPFPLKLAGLAVLIFVISKTG